MNPIHLALERIYSSSAAIITGFTYYPGTAHLNKAVPATEQTRWALPHSGDETKLLRLSANKVRNRSNPSADCIVPSCAQLKTSASTLHPRSIRMVSPIRNISTPKSCSQVTRQLGWDVTSRNTWCTFISLSDCREWYSPRPSRKSDQTLILNKDSWRLLTPRNR